MSSGGPAGGASGYDDAYCNDVLVSLGSILDSGVLGERSRLGLLLRYLVTEELEGRGDRLKAYTVATDALGRGQDFDPSTDSIVRVEVNRLRQAMDYYYATQGSADSIRIEVPRGTYRPVFDRRQPDPAPLSTDKPTSTTGAAPAEPPASPHPDPDLPGEKPKALPGWRRNAAVAGAVVAALAVGAVAALLFRPDIPAPPPGVAAGNVPAAELPTGSVLPEQGLRTADAIPLAVQPVLNLSPDAIPDIIADGLRRDMEAALSRNRSLVVTVMRPDPAGSPPRDIRKASRDLGIEYLLGASLRRTGDRIRIAVELIETSNERLVWARTFDYAADRFLSGEARAGTAIVSELRAPLYNATKRALGNVQQDRMSAWELYLQATWVPGEARSTLAWELQRVALAERALTLDPFLGQAHSVLADKLAYLANVDLPSDTTEKRNEAAMHARRALELASDDADAMFNVAIHYWHAGEIEASARAMRRTLELDPSHVLARTLAESIPWTCAKPPAETIERAVAYDASLSPDNPVRWVTLTWIGTLYINAGDFQRAYEAELRSRQIFNTPDSSMRFAAILRKLGRTEEAAEVVATQRLGWPNLDVHHFAEQVIARRCGGRPLEAFQHELYRDLANAITNRDHRR